MGGILRGRKGMGGVESVIPPLTTPRPCAIMKKTPRQAAQAFMEA